MYYKCVTVVDIFLYSNIYLATPRIGILFRDTTLQVFVVILKICVARRFVSNVWLLDKMCVLRSQDKQRIAYNCDCIHSILLLTT